ncbi:DUF4129 domain-containing transglutaminase family protein [Virgibacillus byunsanensis]|uniref:DUF4129 domain-containing transglutaminase family protein n=1 Tax=Virgibacillus byunsanensis TaxID=570945 RepID=A0ABW3LNR8_9BACI
MSKRVIDNNRIPALYTSILYVCAFLLFLEWLYPVQQITETSNINVFIIYTLFCFFISMLQINWILSFLLKGFGLLFIIDGIFFSQTFLSSLWFEQLYMDLSFNLNAIIFQQWYDLTPLFRSILFLLLIWLMSYLLYYWFVTMKQIFLFVFLTFIYIAVLDTFTMYEADMSIIRTFILSFVALGVTNFLKEITRESVRFSWIKKTPVWVMPMISVVLFSSLVGYASPKYEAQWPDPVPFLTSTAENAGSSRGGGSIQKVGYGEDDSRLGGSFVQDYTPVFQAAATEEHYWRIETKDVYTGKGWETSSDPEFSQQSNGDISLDTFSGSVETEELETMIDFQGNTEINKLVYPYGIEHVSSPVEAQYQLDVHSEAIHTQIDSNDASLSNYTITYGNPSFEINELRQAAERNEDPQEIKERYTQLPSQLPERVSELAEEIVDSEDNRYDQARAVEGYFGRSGFAYQISNVPVPGSGEDYVDQFLFDSQAGYCDNYSTSMVVLLRTLDIPARWAKGFTSGEVIGDDVGGADSSFDVYEVTNANAHSWVEVYFPEVGWVPFEPTQGFSNLSDFHMDLDNNEQDPLEQPETEVPEEQPNLSEEDEDTDAAAVASENNNPNVNWWFVTFGIVALLILLLVLYKTRFRWSTLLVAMKFRNKSDGKTYQQAYHHLLKLLSYRGMPKDTDQTLREYSKRIDLRYRTDAMSHLTNYYERILYKNEVDDKEAQQLTQIWKNLIKEIMA